MKFKQFLSYFYPINEFQTASTLNKNIEVTWDNGQLVLDSKNTNFSFGSLQRVMEIGIQNIGSEKISTYHNSLLLGVAGGCVIKILKKYNFKGKITGIELDPEIITVAKNYFKLNEYTDLEVIEGDANDYVKHANNHYDLIIVDIFQDNIMPDFLFSDDFIVNLKRILSDNGTILFNSIATLSYEFERNSNFEKKTKTYFSKVKKIAQVEGNNEIFLINK